LLVAADVRGNKIVLAHYMNAHRGVEIHIQSLLISALETDSASCPDRFIPGEKSFSSYFTGG
jgi:hypothetical protein